MKIYASPYGGRRYHSDPVCTGLNSTEIARAGYDVIPTITRVEARRRGLTPCQVCKPTPLLVAIQGGAEDQSA